MAENKQSRFAFYVQSQANKIEIKKAVEELEAIAAKVEDAQTGVGDIDKYMRRSKELIESCRAYLRGAREALSDK